MRRTQLTFILCLLAGLFTAANVQAETVKSLTEVAFVSGNDHVEFTISADQALVATDVVAQTDGSILALRFEKTNTSRQWIDSEDAIIKRTLLHPSRRNAPAAVLRIRFQQVVPTAVVENIRVRPEDGALVIAIPRDVATARAWSGAAAPAPKVTAVKAIPKAQTAAVTQLAPVKVSAKVKTQSATKKPAKKGTTKVIAKNQTPSVKTPTVAPKTTAEIDPESIPLAPPATPEKGTDGSDELAAEGEDQPVANALAQSTIEGPKMGTVLTALAFVSFIGFIMWRKMRGTRSKDGAGPLIKPIGTHMLGPKQSLLLVDVAGQMVLLGTTDKGVQMLTTIEPSEGALTPTGADAPAGSDEAEGSSLSDRLGGAVAKFRAAAAKVNAEYADARTQHTENKVERAFFGGRKKAERKAAEEAALDALCDQIVDEAPEVLDRRTARRDFAPVTPLDRPLEEPEPPMSGGTDLLQKLRGLQSA